MKISGRQLFAIIGATVAFGLVIATLWLLKSDDAWVNAYAKAKLAPFKLDIPAEVWSGGGGSNDEPSPALTELAAYKWNCDENRPLPNGNPHAADLITEICWSSAPLPTINCHMIVDESFPLIKIWQALRMAGKFNAARIGAAENGTAVLAIAKQNIRLAELLLADRWYLSTLVADAIIYMTCDSAAPALQKLSEAQLDRLDAAAAGIAGIYRHESDSSLAADFFVGRKNVQATDCKLKFGIDPETFRKVESDPALNRLAWRTFVDDLAMIIEIRQLTPFQQRADQMKALEGEIKSDLRPERAYSKIAFGLIFMGNYFDCRALVKLAMLRCAIAMEKIRRADGAYPAEIPGIDPYTGQPFKFKDGTLYSFGKDGIDDGGTPGPFSGAGDITIRL